MATILQFDAVRAVDINSFAVPGALATFYDSGTSRIRTVYADSDCTIPHPSPLIADGAGVFPPVYDVGGGDVRVDMTAPSGVMLAGYPMDPIAVVSTTAAGASGIAFNPTEEIPETNVQDAIERVQANIVEPLADYGLGVTGNATLLVDIDASGTASGFYRFDGTTSGTFPSGVVAADGGVVRIYRATATSAFMELQKSESRRIYVRRLSGTTWEDWSWLISSADTVSSSTWRAGTSTTPAAATPAAIIDVIKSQVLGWGQTWDNVARNVGQSYRNTTGRPIQVCIDYDGGSSDRVQVSTNGSTWVSLCWQGKAVTFTVPPNHYYRLTGGSHNFWSECR